MATTASLKQIFYPGFLEDMIIERVQGILYDNAKEVEEEKKAEIKVYEDQCVGLQEDLVKAQNKITSLEMAEAQAKKTIKSLELTQAQASQDHAEVLELFGRLQQRFARMHPSPHTSATRTITPDSSFRSFHLNPPAPESKSKATEQEDMVVVETPTLEAISEPDSPPLADNYFPISTTTFRKWMPHTSPDSGSEDNNQFQSPLSMRANTSKADTPRGVNPLDDVLGSGSPESSVTRKKPKSKAASKAAYKVGTPWGVVSQVQDEPSPPPLFDPVSNVIEVAPVNVTEEPGARSPGFGFGWGSTAVAKEYVLPTETPSDFVGLGSALGWAASKVAEVAGEPEKPSETGGLGSLLGWGSSKTTVLKGIIGPLPEPTPEPVKAAEEESSFAPVANKKMTKKEREKMKRKKEAAKEAMRKAEDESA
ncbi:hypothetical protein DL96DRAFT_1768214 [Flagelloscypha sp. PMI_526]|nr:hypothetical protein DL96DRAFT_1768214 [Flagelloscypha sp. PMI_526]